ncbi:kunitz-type protease inhibitor 2 [Chiroxiphia lanceolata]|uniref:kunitz-type protease inhibitor 2 n=1 Tax=Chiroxiphia lanceolata TaxID=296741 RepID=UPI0013CEF671|nr:kunitz-type protease inhibitor 2 [Chiroxiphia lanceolata]
MAAGRLLPLLLLLLLGGVRGVPAPEPPPPNTALDDRCRLPAITGRCRASIPRWFFNASSGTCESFVFGGCGGNGNNFGSERECREGCGGVPERAPNRPNSTLAERCSAPPVTGPCRASFVRWYFIPAENSCREFTYGGCRGNGNNHPDREECLRRCRPPAGDPGAEFRRFLATKGLVLGGLLAAGAALGFGIRAGLRLLRRKRDLAGSGSGSKPPRDDTECLMKEAYTV